ncbi:MAG: hypothetical protein COC22_01425 [Flavobacteriaceae bacterium]|nr:MAG: hypothetical protein COC22_01425 [Flavobacteriaceae bacterium]
MRGLLTALMLAMGLSACGYHLVGQGGDSGVIPEDATQIVVVGNAGKLFTVFRQKLAQTVDVPVVRAKDAIDDGTGNSIEVRMENFSESMTASAFDASGIANQYRVTISASLRVLQSGKELWASEAMSVSGDVFVTGGAVAIEAHKERVSESLRDEWVQKALGRLRSGF